jgi:hypothetical protein
MLVARTEKLNLVLPSMRLFHWLKRFFEQARASDFLMGRGKRSAGHEGWQCDLDFLMSDKGLKAVVEKTEVAA